jgi:Zn-dependent protease with chaperone function
MTRKTHTLPITFTALSAFVFLLGIYVLTTKSTLHPQFFITACGEVLKNVREHVHFNPDGLLSSFILLTTAMGISLTVVQTIRFILSHRRLSSRLGKTEKLPGKLSHIIQRQHLQSIPLSVVGGRPTAYTIGLLRPRIVVSLSLIQKTSDKQLEAIILHEFYHLKNRHLLWLLISRLVSSLFFFIPLIEYLAQQLKTEFELTADSFVVSKQKTRDHLCGSLALNLQYAGGVIPHFATSPIEKRVESLLSHKVVFDKIGIIPFSLSLFSIALMIGLALARPNQIVAGFHNDSEAICKVGEKCQNKDCSDQISKESSSFSSSMPASFSLSSSY